MNKFLKNIHLVFWGCIPIFLLYGYFNREHYIDVNIHDTMFVIALVHVMIFLSLYFFLVGLFYYYQYKKEKFKLIKMFTILHVALTFTGLVILFIMPEHQDKLPIESTSDIKDNLRDFRINHDLKMYSLLGILIAQFILFLNLIISIFRR